MKSKTEGMKVNKSKVDEREKSRGTDERKRGGINIPLWVVR